MSFESEIQVQTEIANDSVEASIVDDIKKAFSISSLGDFIKGLLKSNREIETVKSGRDEEGNLIYDVNMLLLGDDEVVDAAIPAKIKLAKVSEDNSGSINLFVKLPAENYKTSKEFVDVDTSEYQNIDNSKDLVSRACWKLFDSVDYLKDEEFLSQFLTKETQAKFEMDEETSDLESNPIEQSTDISTCKYIRMSVKKITSSESSYLQLQNISATYDPDSVLEDVQLILNDEDMLDEINSDDVSVFDVTVTDNNIDVDNISDTELTSFESECIISGYDSILNSAYILLTNCMHMNTTACGKDMDKIRNFTDSYIWRIQGQINTLNMMMVESGLSCLNPGVRIQGIDPSLFYIDTETYFESFYLVASANITSFVNALHLYSCNFNEIQLLELESMITSWDHELNYFLKRIGM